MIPHANLRVCFPGLLISGHSQLNRSILEKGNFRGILLSLTGLFERYYHLDQCFRRSLVATRLDASPQSTGLLTALISYIDT